VLNYTIEPRYWSPRQGYATGDVLIGLLNQGWEIRNWQPAPGQPTRAPMFIVTLAHETDLLSLLVLDGPAVRDVLMPRPDAAALNSGQPILT
jgi:hypothetical protein